MFGPFHTGLVVSTAYLKGYFLEVRTPASNGSRPIPTQHPTHLSIRPLSCRIPTVCGYVKAAVDQSFRHFEPKVSMANHVGLNFYSLRLSNPP